jgi:hypothetical protein
MAPFRAPRDAHERPRRATRIQKADESEAAHNNKVHVVPYIRGIRMLSEREADETAKYGEVQTWSSDSEEAAHRIWGGVGTPKVGWVSSLPFMTLWQTSSTYFILLICMLCTRTS